MDLSTVLVHIMNQFLSDQVVLRKIIKDIARRVDGVEITVKNSVQFHISFCDK